MIDYSTIVQNTKVPYYKIKCKYEHGDADSTTYESSTYNEKEKEEFEKTLKFYFKVLNFKPNCAYANMGYYYPIKDIKQLENIIAEFWPDVLYPSDLVHEYLASDVFYRDGIATLEKVEVYVNGIKRILLDEDARQSNLITLPKIGSKIETSMGHINGSSKMFKNAISYQDITKKHGIPLKLDKRKKEYTPVSGIIIDIKRSERHLQYDTYDILFKIDTLDDVHTITQTHGWDPNYKDD